MDDIPAVFLRHYPAYKKKQLNVSELARVCDLSRTTVYKYYTTKALQAFMEVSNSTWSHKRNELLSNFSLYYEYEVE